MSKKIAMAAGRDATIFGDYENHNNPGHRNAGNYPHGTRDPKPEGHQRGGGPSTKASIRPLDIKIMGRTPPIRHPS